MNRIRNRHMENLILITFCVCLSSPPTDEKCLKRLLLFVFFIGVMLLQIEELSVPVVDEFEDYWKLADFAQTNFHFIQSKFTNCWFFFVIIFRNVHKCTSSVAVTEFYELLRGCLGICTMENSFKHSNTESFCGRYFFFGYSTLYLKPYKYVCGLNFVHLVAPS